MGVSSGNVAADGFGARGPHECPEPPAPSAGEITPPYLRWLCSSWRLRRAAELPQWAPQLPILTRAKPARPRNSPAGPFPLVASERRRDPARIGAARISDATSLDREALARSAAAAWRRCADGPSRLRKAPPCHGARGERSFVPPRFFDGGVPNARSLNRRQMRMSGPCLGAVPEFRHDGSVSIGRRASSTGSVKRNTAPWG
jgi:hypothetical protein